MDGYMKANAAAKYAGVCANTLRSWRGAGLKFYRISHNVVLYKATDIDDFITKRSAQSSVPAEELRDRVRKTLALVD